jgi:carbonic anhydrase/acetyltransferase-like protein (isoleucine patch superfamily)
MQDILNKYFSKGVHKGERVFIAPGAVVIGNVELADDASIWYHAVLRGDIAPLIVGKRSNIQDNCVLHIASHVPVTIGDDVSVGHGAILHSCTIGNNVLVGMNSTILDHAVIGDNSIVAAGSVVPPRKVFPPNSMIMGSPAKVSRELSEADIEYVRNNALRYVEVKDYYLENIV